MEINTAKASRFIQIITAKTHIINNRGIKTAGGNDEKKTGI